MDVGSPCAHARDPIRRPEPTNPSRRRVSTVNAAALRRRHKLRAAALVLSFPSLSFRLPFFFRPSFSPRFLSSVPPPRLSPRASFFPGFYPLRGYFCSIPPQKTNAALCGTGYRYLLRLRASGAFAVERPTAARILVDGWRSGRGNHRG